MTNTNHTSEQPASVHTQGDWYLNGSYGDYEYATIETKERVIAIVLTEGEHEATEEEKANADLLRAAPILLEALLRFNPLTERSQEDYLVRARAIAKAKGLPHDPR